MNDARIAFRALPLYLASAKMLLIVQFFPVIIAYLPISGITDEEYRAGKSKRLRRKPVILVKSRL